jgi:osmoprotectant transport system permease protein
MLKRLISPDRVAATGVIIGLISLPLGWLTLRPNRLAGGTGMALWDGMGWGAAAAIMALWLACLALVLTGKNRRHIIALGICLNLVIFATFIFSGSGASHLLQGAAPVSRVSLGAGVWVTSLGAYIAIFSCRQRLQNSPVWQNVISWSGLIPIAVMLASGWLNDLSVVVEFHRQQAQFGRELWNHILLFSGSVIAGAVIGIPLGIWAARSRRAEKPIFFITNIVQTVPSLALFGLLIAPLTALSVAYPVLREWGISGIGAAPAVIALVLYSLLPVARNTYTGLRHLDPAVIDAGTGMGMSRMQVFKKIEVPLSAPLVLEGIRTASVQAVGNTAVAALIGAGGLGWFIFQGISQAAGDVVILGAVPIMLMALVVDIVMRQAVRIATPKGLAAR